MDRPRDCRSESEREGEISYDLPLCGIEKETIQMNFQNRKGLIEGTYGCWQRGRMGGRGS